MNYVVSSILQQIQEQNPSAEKQLRICLNSFEDIRIYETIAKELHRRYDDSLKVETRLSLEKWKDFQERGNSDRSAMYSMGLHSHGWIARDHSLDLLPEFFTGKCAVDCVNGYGGRRESGEIERLFFP